MKRISLFVVDDHPLVLIGLRDFLTAQRDMRVLGTETDPARVTEAAARLKPDVLIVDLMMPGLSGLEVVSRVLEVRSVTRLVVLSMYSDVAYVAEALHRGALGYVLKCAAPEDLLRAIRSVVRGVRYLSPPLSEDEIRRYVQRARQPGVEPYEMLTRREREVLQLVARGETSAAIAARLGIGVRTVESHRANLLGKLGVRNQAALVRYAIRHGLAPLE